MLLVFLGVGWSGEVLVGWAGVELGWLGLAWLACGRRNLLSNSVREGGKRLRVGGRL